MINIDELHKEKNEKIKHKNKIYEQILEKCHNRIKFSAKIIDSPNNCFFIVPQYEYGIPIYNLNKCIVFIVKSLMSNGFEVTYTSPNILFISWEGKSNPKNYKLLEKRDKGYKTIEDYKPTGNLIYDKNTLDVFKKKTSNLFN